MRKITECPCLNCRETREEALDAKEEELESMDEGNYVIDSNEPTDEVIWGDGDVWVEGVYQPKCPCGSACWRCHPEPSSITNEDVLWNDDHLKHQPFVSAELQNLVRQHGAVKIQRALDETTAGAFLEYCGADAQRWAQEYCGMFGGDEGLMIGWFANAIEAGKAARNDG